jgi:hypothetical protein
LQLSAVPRARPAIEHAIASGASDAHEMIESRRRARVLSLRVLDVLDEALPQGLYVE